jgi:hypothetical protein
MVLMAGLLAGAAPIAAQGNDPTTAVKGTGQLPAGWQVRFDPSRAGRPAATPADVNFRAMGDGYHHNSGPAGVFYRTETASGNYTLSATFAQTKSSDHEAYGLVFGGRDLQTPRQNYLYFIVHPKDGKYLINHRSSDERPTAVVAYTPHAAINKDAAGTGAATNTLAVRVAGDSVHFMVNGTTVQTLAKSALDGGSTDGNVGLRLNHNLDLHISGFGVKK